MRQLSLRPCSCQRARRLGGRPPSPDVLVVGGALTILVSFTARRHSRVQKGRAKIDSRLSGVEASIAARIAFLRTSI